jgi:hypothetical protein
MIFDCFQRSEMNDDRSDRGVGVLVEKFKKRVYRYVPYPSTKSAGRLSCHELSLLTSESAKNKNHRPQTFWTMSTSAKILVLYCSLFSAVESFITPQFRKKSFSLKAFKEQNHVYSRRAFTSIVATLTVLSDFHSEQVAASAEDLVSSTSTESDKGLTQSQIYNFLHVVPTFTIVDKTGVPYMVVGEDAKLTAYFFTSYSEASRILASASKSSDRVIADLEREENVKRKAKGETPMSKEELNDEVGENPWKGARISTVPLDFGVSLSTRGKMNGQYFRVAPSEVRSPSLSFTRIHFNKKFAIYSR